MIRPKLRKLDRFPLEREGESLLVLQDPHRLDDPLAVDPLLAEYLDMMDGKRSVAQIRQSLLMRGRPALPLDELQAVVDTLEECGFLEDDHFRARWAQALREFEANPALEPVLRGVAYPGEQEPLHQGFASLHSPPSEPEASALIWPYSPYPFMGPNAGASAALGALPDPQRVDGILLLVTSHHDGATPYQILDKRFATALGPVPGARDIAQALIRPRPWLAQEPLRWKGEQALEVPLLALRARYGDACPLVLPLLCGRACFSPKQDEAQVLQSASLLAELENLLGTQRWLLIASAQLGHETLDQKDSLDPSLLRALEQKQESFFFPKRMAKIPSQQRPAGAPVLATFLSILPPSWRFQGMHHQRPLTIDGAGTVGHAFLRYGLKTS